MPVPDENHQNEELTSRERGELRTIREHMDEFLGIASHELKTPLTTIKGSIQLARLRLNHILRKLGQEEAPFENDLRELGDLLDRAERQVDVQNRLIRDLLDSSHMQAGWIELNPEPCELTRIVREAVEDQRSATPARIIHIVMAEEETLPVIADPERIEQVVRNFLTNALKYSSEHCLVEVSLERREEEARVAVRDQGPGLEPAEQQQIWERFYQVKGMKRQKGFSVGLGLGLYICKALIQEHHGNIGVESASGAGSTFWFTLPLVGPHEWEAAF